MNLTTFILSILLIFGMVLNDQFMFTLADGASESSVFEFARLLNYTDVEPMFSFPSRFFLMYGHPKLDHRSSVSRALAMGHRLEAAIIRTYKANFEARAFSYDDGEKLPENYYFPSPLNIGELNYGRHNVPENINGSGVLVVIPDGGIQCSHKAFVDCDAKRGKSYVKGSSSTEPESSRDVHATMCASIICANNGYGGGLANGAKCVPHRFITESGIVTNFDEMRAFAIDEPAIVSVALGPEDGVWGYEVRNAAIVAAIDESADRGSIRFDASGNGGSSMGESCSTDWSVSSKNTPGVSSIGSSGRVAKYSEKCPGVAFSGFGGYLTGSNSLNVAYPDPSLVAWSTQFDGTSATVPQIAAIAALAKQANPKLRQRSMMQAMIKTASRTGLVSFDYPFVTNAAGYQHSLAFGFGYPKADKLIEYVTSPTWTPPPVEQKCGGKTFTTKIERAKDGNRQIVVHIENCGIQHIEFVEISVDFVLDNSLKMDSLTLTSPLGTTSIFIQKYHRYQFRDWEYQSGGWTWYGESTANGDWVIKMNALVDFNIASAGVLVWGY